MKKRKNIFKKVKKEIKKEVKKETLIDPDIPLNKQRHLR